MVSAGVYLVEQDVSAFTQTTSSLRPGIAIRGSWGPYNEVTAITSVKDLFEKFGQPANGNYVGLITAKKYLTYNNIIQVLRVASAADVVAVKTFKDNSAVDSLKVEAKYKGSAGNDITITISGTTIKVYFKGVLKETFSNVTKGVATDKNLPYKTAINGVSKFIVIADDATSDANAVVPADVTTSALVNGADSLPTASELVGATPAEGANVFSSDNISINLLLCPDAALLPSDSDIATVGNALITICEARKDAITLVDIPKGSSVAAAITFKTSTAAYNSSYAACYWSWTEVHEAAISGNVDLPGSSIALLGITKSDAMSYPWFAAAGYVRGVVTEGINVEYNPDQGSRDLLAEAQINPIVFRSGDGVVLFGNLTTITQSTALQSLNVRRLLLAAKASIKAVADGLLFEQNDSDTRSKFTERSNAILSNIAAKRGLYDFRVICDGTNNTDDIIAQKKMVGYIKLKPTLAAEEIIVSFQVLSTGAEFTD